MPADEKKAFFATTIIMTNPDDRSLNHSEQLRIVYQALPLSLSGSALAGVVLVSALWQVIPRQALLIWLMLFGLVILYRSVIYLGFQRSQHKQAPHWAGLFNGGVFLAGCAWGGVSLWLFPHDSVHYQIFIVFSISGVIAAAAVSLSAQWRTFLLFMVPALLPLVARLSLIPSGINLAVSIGTLIFMTFMVINARHGYRNIRQNIFLRQGSLENKRAMLASKFELEESRQMLRWVLDTIPVSVFWKDTRGVYLGCNQMFATGVGLARPHEVIGKTDAQLPKTRRIVMGQCDEKTVIESNTPLLHQQQSIVPAEGKIRWLDCSIVPLTDVYGRVIGVLGASQDITEQKRMDEIKNEFISTVSHELRTPLTSIRGAIGLLLGIGPDKDSQQYADLLSIAHNNTERLLILIDDLLNIQKIESGDMDFNLEPVRLSPFLQQVVQDNLTLAGQYAVHFVIEQADADAVVKADPQRLTQVITNLLSNAAKFSRAGQTVELGITSDEHSSYIYVQDHGVGIPSAFYARLFDRFTQWDASNTRQAGGTGLGLSIVKSIVERHGGRLRFESQEGVGTRFDIELPLMAQAETAETAC